MLEQTEHRQTEDRCYSPSVFLVEPLETFLTVIKAI